MTFAEAGEQFEYIIGCSFFNVEAVRFFLCIVEYGSIIIILIFLYKFKSFNRIIGKPDESLGRKATGSLKWQPAA